MRLNWNNMRERAGVIVLDAPRYLPALATGRWTALRNRKESLGRAPDGEGYSMDAPWSSDLHACRVFPSWAREVLGCAARQWSFQWSGPPPVRNEPPRVSFIVPHRGRERIPLVQTTIAAILHQEDIPVECIVVEQSEHGEWPTGEGPRGARHIHLPHPSDPEGWHFAWAFNEGARAARSDILVFHDGDVVPPRGYAREIVRHLDQGWAGVYLQRFLFCLSESDSQELERRAALPPGVVPERVRQNWKGGTRAVRRADFIALGGFDEGFVGWGGEDNEFFDRMLALRVRRFGYIPFLHLWHPPQAAKMDGRRERNRERWEALMREPRESRIARLHESLASRWAAAPPPKESTR